MARRVLYIDDDRINGMLFEETCRLAGDVTLELAGSGAEALEVAGRFQPDLLVIDLHLPDTNGFALLQALRALLDDPVLRAFLCTADEGQALVDSARAAGFDGCWTKPVPLQEVLHELTGGNERSAGTP